ncbi:MAG: alpha/beta fold hydrolase [Gemmataceae bacterium]|nr:alpha/beta fold hydrolase [Gemmataceae bacterium]
MTAADAGPQHGFNFRSPSHARPAFQTLVVSLAATLALSGCLTLRRHSPTSVPAAPANGVVFVANGAGNFQVTSRILRELFEREKLQVHVATFEWSHGYLRILADQACYRYALAQGKRLAQEIEAYAKDHPHMPIYLVGHSAGSTVALSALEHMPPGLVERAFLLSPSVSNQYDIRPAVRSVNRGLHVFYSRHDYWYLGLATHVLGTADRRFIHPASGRVGFEVQTEHGDFALQAKLFQRPWQPVDAQTGNLGGHYGNYAPAFLKRHLLPLLEPVKS